MIKRETVVSLLAGFLAGACGIFPAVAGSGFDFGPAQGSGGGVGGSGDLTAITETGSGITITSGTGPVPDLALEAGLEAIAGLAKADGNVIVGDGSTWVAESGATARTSLGLAIGTNVQAASADLDNLVAALSVSSAGVFTWGTGLGGVYHLTGPTDVDFAITSSNSNDLVFNGSDDLLFQAADLVTLESLQTNMQSDTTAYVGSQSVTGSGTSELSGFKRRIYTYTGGSGAATTLTQSQSGAIITNTGATEETYITLPTLDGAEDLGIYYTFDCKTASAGSYGLRFTAASGDTITVGTDTSASAGYVRTTIANSCVTIYAHSTTEWRAYSGSLGPWEVN